MEQRNALRINKNQKFDEIIKYCKNSKRQQKTSKISRADVRSRKATCSVKRGHALKGASQRSARGEKIKYKKCIMNSARIQDRVIEEPRTFERAGMGMGYLGALNGADDKALSERDGLSRVTNIFESRSGIGAGNLEEHVRATRVLVEELGDVEDLAAPDEPHVGLLVVLLDLLHGVLLRHG